MPDTAGPSTRWRQAVPASDPATTVLTALELTHPALSAPVRGINDTVDHTINGETYVALRFGGRRADDVEGQAPPAGLYLDNVGQVLTQWVESSGGGAGAQVTIMQVVEDVSEGSMTLDIVGIRVGSEQVAARLGYDPMLSRPAVQLRHDPVHSPGLF